MVEKTIRIKKRGGGTRLQRVKVLASGKFRFVKNKAKSVKKTIAKRRKTSKTRRKSQQRNTTTKRSKPVAKKGRRRAQITSGFNRITKNKFVRGAVLGLGGGALVVQVTDRFAPQFSGIAGPVGAFIFGGPVGFVAHLLLQGGLGGIFGGVAGGGNGMKVTV